MLQEQPSLIKSQSVTLWLWCLGILNLVKFKTCVWHFHNEEMQFLSLHIKLGSIEGGQV